MRGAIIVALAMCAGCGSTSVGDGGIASDGRADGAVVEDSGSTAEDADTQALDANPPLDTGARDTGPTPDVGPTPDALLAPDVAIADGSADDAASMGDADARPTGDPDATAPVNDADAAAMPDDAETDADAAAMPDDAETDADATAMGSDADATVPSSDADATGSGNDATVQGADATVQGADATAMGSDAGATDALPSDTGPAYNCGAFSVNPGWTIQPGFHAVVVADASDGLNQPVALSFAGGSFGPVLYSVNQGDNTLRATEVFSGATTVFAAAAALTPAPRLLTGIVWDRTNAFDGNLYVGDQGTDADGDSRVYRVLAAGTGTVLASGPGPALDDVFGLAFSPGGAYPAGLYVSGDTDGAGPDWGRIDASGVTTAFSEQPGNEGIAVDTSGLFGNLMYSASPLGGGYPGDGTIAAVLPNGTRGATLAVNLGGVHAPVFAPGGAYGRDLYAARWDVGQLVRVAAAGGVTVIASGLSLTNYDANILAFSPDGNVLYVADRQAHRIVCIEPL